MKLAVDPGIRGCGASVFDKAGVLVAARYIVNPVKKGNGIEAVLAMARAVVDWACVFPITSVVIERMQIRTNSPGNPNISLLPLVGVGYAIAASFPQAVGEEFETPRDWKGSADGVAMTLSIRERLTPEEFLRVALPASACAECSKHFGRYCLKGKNGCGADHVYDAIGIGLKKLGRLERKRVIPR